MMLLSDNKKIEYQIFIGCNDAHDRKTLVSEKELRETISAFFSKEHIDFSMVSLKGGFLHSDGRFVIEDTLCIDIITDNEKNIKNLAKVLSMFMDQESILIIKYNISMEFR